MGRLKKMLILITAIAVPGGAIAYGVWYLWSHCNHELSFPFTDKKRGITTRKCMKCAKEFEYNWKTMKLGKEVTLNDRNSTIPTIGGASGLDGTLVKIER